MNRMFVCPQNSYFEALTSSVVVFRDGAILKVGKVKWGLQGGALI